MAELCQGSGFIAAISDPAAPRPGRQSNPCMATGASEPQGQGQGPAMIRRFHVLNGIDCQSTWPSLTEAKTDAERRTGQWLSVWDSEADVGATEMWALSSGKWSACAVKQPFAVNR